MEINNALILDAEEPLSKAVNEIFRTGTAVIVMKNRTYLGIIDDRNIRLSIADIGKAKCGNASVRAPVLYPHSPLLEQLNAFLAGYFKALPVVDERKSLPLGLTTRVDVLKALLVSRLVPKKPVSEVMNSPVYTVDLNSTLADAKTRMKQFNAHRLVVLNNGYPYGIISTYDLVSILQPKGRKDNRIICEVDKEKGIQLSELVRESLVTVDLDGPLEDSLRKMIDETSSHVLVLANKKPAGIIAAVDIFKAVLDLTKEKISITISGLDSADMQHYKDIEESLAGVLNKFSKSFFIRGAMLHIKKGKSVYTAKLFVDMDRDTLSVSMEDYKLGETIRKLTNEVYILLNKKKGIVKNRKRERFEA